jgi:hypothetical protein
MGKANPRIRELLGLKVMPNYSTLQRFYERIRELEILSVFRVVLKRLKKASSRGRRALRDSTGLLHNPSQSLLSGLWLVSRKSGEKT